VFVTKLKKIYLVNRSINKIDTIIYSLISFYTRSIIKKDMEMTMASADSKLIKKIIIITKTKNT
jgi:hypothetical protein